MIQSLNGPLPAPPPEYMGRELSFFASALNDEMHARRSSLPELRTRRNRTGVIYVTVLAIGTLVLVMAMGALLASRSLLRATSMSNDADSAADYAFSAIELSRYMIANDSYWRTDYSPGVWFSNKTIGKGTMSCSVTTADNTFSNYSENLTILGTGYRGSATQYIQATLHSVIAPLSCMSSVIAVGGAVTVNGNPINSTSAGLATNSTITATGNAAIAIPVSAVGAISGSQYEATAIAGSSAIVLPTATNVFSTAAYNSANPVTISFSALQGNGKMEKILLSPASNPYGSGSTNGVYIINCGGSNIQIDNDRIVGTLVLLNAGTVTINGPINWAPAVSNYPCLMIQGGTLTMNLGTATLNEGAPIPNLNPSGTPYPYPSGASNTTTTDTYPSIISGLIYTSGNAQITGSCAIQNLIVAGTLQISGGPAATISPTYNSIYYSNPPIGFYSNNLTTDSNEYSRTTN